MRLRSIDFVGAWPPGIHWSPGEERELPEGYPVEGEPPAGLERVQEDGGDDEPR